MKETYVPRESGILVSQRALPGDDSRGTIGDSLKLLDFAQKSGFKNIHDLPSTIPDKHGSPYSSVSSFAIDLQRIHIEALCEYGDLERGDVDRYYGQIAGGSEGPDISVKKKQELLAKAYVNFDNNGSRKRKEKFEDWCGLESDWLDSYATFEILKDLDGNEGKRWQDWEHGKDYSKDLVQKTRSKNRQKFREICYAQWIAEQQTLEYLDQAERDGITIYGDIPFYTGDCDVWSSRGVFNLDENGNNLTQGGAPPSLTSNPEGQAWGNPTYKIDPNDPSTTERVVGWWSKRLKRTSKLCHVVRLDYFIGFEEACIVPADAKNGLEYHIAEKGFGHELFEYYKEKYGNLPVYPEDLGAMTEEITGRLRDEYDLETSALGVRAFSKFLVPGDIPGYENDRNFPDNFTQKTVAFSSNHDQPSLVMAMKELSKKRPESYRYLKDLLDEKSPFSSNRELRGAEAYRAMGAQMMRWMSVSEAGQVVYGIWDLLGIPMRYNTPGTTGDHNWSRRFTSDNMRTLARLTPSLRELNKRDPQEPWDMSDYLKRVA